jgi:hypothetical protein
MRAKWVRALGIAVSLLPSAGCTSLLGDFMSGGEEDGGADGTADASQDTGNDTTSEAPPGDGNQEGATSDVRGDQQGGPDGGPALGAGSLLVAGTALSAWVVTSDGYVAYADDTTGVASAVPLTGGTSQQIAAGKPGATAIARLGSPLTGGNTKGVAVLTNTAVADGGIPNLPFTTWTSSGGAQSWWGPGTRTYDLAGASDGSHVSWFKLDSTGTKGSLDVSSSAFQQVYTVATGIAAPPYPPLAFGGVNGTDLIVLLPSQVLEAYDTTTGTAKTISSTVSPEVLGQFVLDPTGMHVAFLDGSGSLWVATAPGYSPVLVSSAANLQAFPFFSPDGATLYFNDSAGTIYRSPVPAPSSTTITTGATLGIDAVSPDGNWLLASTTYASNAFPEQDVRIVASQASGATLTAVDAQPRVFEEVFTADSSHVLEATSPMTVAGMSGGLPLAPETTLLSYDIAFKVLSAPITTSMLLSAIPATGSQAVFFDNPRAGSAPGALVCDLRLVDVGKPSPTSTLIQAGVVCGSRVGLGQLPAGPLLSADGKTVVYAYQGTAYRPGVYAYALP